MNRQTLDRILKCELGHTEIIVTGNRPNNAIIVGFKRYGKAKDFKRPQ